MYRVTKVLNHNTVVAIQMDDKKETLIVGKGVGFGKKVGERFAPPPEAMLYLLLEKSTRGNASELVRHMDPVYLDIVNQIIVLAKERFENLDTGILIPLADHISFAAERMEKNIAISNPLTQDIRALFPEEYEIAEAGKAIIEQETGIVFPEDEVGFIALHLHAALDELSVSQAMQTARVIRDCIEMVQRRTGQVIDVSSLSYNRMMTHIKYMVARIVQGDRSHVDINEFMKLNYSQSFAIAEELCSQLEQELKLPLDQIEIGYLAMHIERVFDLEKKKDDN